MKRYFEKQDDILFDCISGFHAYCLSAPVHLTYVSDNLCKMTGFACEELMDDITDGYEKLIHPADVDEYRKYINCLAESAKSLTVEYRIVTKSEKIIYIKDTATSIVGEDGQMVAYSTLADITSIKAESEDAKIFADSMPYGFIRYTCEQQPKITYMNKKMEEMFRFPQEQEGEMDYLEFYKNNIYLMIPMEGRRKFHHFLNEVYDSGETISGELEVLRCDGTKAKVYGWVSVNVNENGQEEFQSVLMDITEKYRQTMENDIDRYISALTQVYDKIFEYDTLNMTVKCLYGDGFFGKLKNIPMQLEEAKEKWISEMVAKEDRDSVRNYFSYIYQQNYQTQDGRPKQITYKAKSSTGENKTYSGIFIKVNSSVSLFCCRRVEEADNDSLRNENIALKNMNENMQELVMRYTDGMVAFEVKDDKVKPLYASDNVCNFFGYTKEEWIPMTQTSQPIKEFVARSGFAYADFLQLFEKGEFEFSYEDLNTGKSRPIKAICSQKETDGSNSFYIMLYNVDEKRKSNEAEKNGNIYIRTFGYFDVFIDDKPVAFRNKKSKELLALLVDRRGGFVTSEEAISYLWEDEDASTLTLARYRKVALRLKNILEEYGISDIVESIDGKRRIVMDKVSCDLYDYLSGDEQYAQLFKGSYLTNYSWGENTLGELINEHHTMIPES